MPFLGRLYGRLYNVHWIDSHVARSAQAYAGGFAALLSAYGFRTVINLRGENPRSGWWRSERAAAAAAGAAYRDAALNSRRLPEKEQLLALLGLLDRAAKPVLLKCSGGADRTSFVAGLYLLHRGEADAAAAARLQTAFWPYLHWPRRHQRWIRAFFDFFAEDAHGRPLRAWLDDAYTPARFAAWLEGKGLSGGFRPLIAQA